MLPPFDLLYSYYSKIKCIVQCFFWGCIVLPGAYGLIIKGRSNFNYGEAKEQSGYEKIYR